MSRDRALEMAREFMDQTARNEPETVTMRRLADLLESMRGEELEEVARVCARWVESNRAWLLGAGRGYDTDEIEKVRSETETLVVVMNEIRALATGEGR